MVEAEKPKLPVIDTHRALIANRRAMISALAKEPGLGRMLFANPAQAFIDAGYTISPEMAKHMQHTLQLRPEVRTRHDELVAELRKSLGVVPHPTDATWLAKTVFGKLEVTPLATTGLTPAYFPSIPDDATERLMALLPSKDVARLPARPTGPVKEAVWRLDLTVEAPKCHRVKKVPTELSLEELWFYRPLDPNIPLLLELGIIDASTTPILVGSRYRDVKSGKTSNGLIDWIGDVTFPTERPKG